MYEIQNNGFDNEYFFVKYFNGKRICDLDPIGQSLILALYPSINLDSIIKCWRNHFPQKTDIFLKINDRMKGISIKKGSRNSVHVDTVTNFVSFLSQSGVPKDIINSYLKYHYADGTVNGKGKKRLSVEEYKEKNQQSIDDINRFFNKERLVKRAVERFVIRGTNSVYQIDALICGKPNDYLWLTRKQIYEIISSNKNVDSTAIHFGQLTVQPKTRCLNYNSKYEKDRYCVQVKWYSLFDDIIEYLHTHYNADNCGSYYSPNAK